MNRGWSVREVGFRIRAGIAISGPVARGLTPGNQFGTDHGHLTRGLDPEPDLPPFKADDGHANVVSDEEFLHQLPRQYQHGTIPSSTPEIGSYRQWARLHGTLIPRLRGALKGV
jgi:hypothetical protein